MVLPLPTFCSFEMLELVSLDSSLIDIDQWNKVTQVLGTPPSDFFKQLQPSVSMHLYEIYQLMNFTMVVRR